MHIKGCLRGCSNWAPPRCGSSPKWLLGSPPPPHRCALGHIRVGAREIGTICQIRIFPGKRCIFCPKRVIFGDFALRFQCQIGIFTGKRCIFVWSKKGHFRRFRTTFSANVAQVLYFMSPKMALFGLKKYAPFCCTNANLTNGARGGSRHFSCCFPSVWESWDPENTAKQGNAKNDKSTLFYTPPPGKCVKLVRSSFSFYKVTLALRVRLSKTAEILKSVWWPM